MYIGLKFKTEHIVQNHQFFILKKINKKHTYKKFQYKQMKQNLECGEKSHSVVTGSNIQVEVATWFFTSHTNLQHKIKEY